MSDSWGERQKQPVILTPEVGHDVWSMIKTLRDDAHFRMITAQTQYEQLNDLLQKLKDNGAADHLPTLDEVREYFRKPRA